MSQNPPPDPSLKAKVFSGLLWSIVRNWGSRLVALGTFVVLARHVEAGDMGLIAAALAVLAFIEIFTEQGLTSAIVQRPQMTPALLNAAFVVNLAAATFALAVILIGAPWIAQAMNVPPLTPVLQVVAFSIVFNALGFGQQAMCMRNFAYKWLALRSLVATAVSGVVGVGLVLLGYGVWGLVAQAVLVAVINTLMLWLKPQWRPSWEFDFASLRSLMGYSVKVFASQLVNFGNTRFIEIFLAATLGPAALGLYAVGMRIHQSLQQLLNSAVLQVAHSGFSRLAAQPRRLLGAYHAASTASAAVAAPAFWLTGLLGPELAEIVYGQRWIDASKLMLPMALLGAVQTVQFYNGSVIDAVGKPSLTLAINLAKLAAAAASLLLTVGQPLEVIVWAFVIGQLCVTPLSYAMARRGFGLPLGDTLRRLAPFALAMAAMAGAVFGIRGSGELQGLGAWSRLGLLFLAAAGSYLIVVLSLGWEPLRATVMQLRRRKQGRSPRGRTKSRP